MKQNWNGIKRGLKQTPDDQRVSEQEGDRVLTTGMCWDLQKK